MKFLKFYLQALSNCRLISILVYEIQIILITPSTDYV